jgi:ABC-type Fe3+ transport system substrate-binding protein
MTTPGWTAAAALAGITMAASSLAMAAEWDAGAPKVWGDLLAAAKKEGAVVVSVCSGATETLGKAFKRDTGIDISFVTGSIPELGSKWDAELKSGRVTTDVRLDGTSSPPYAKQGYLVPVKDELLLPNVTNQSNWLNGRLLWMDSGQKFLPVPAEYVAAFPLINTDLIDAKSITKWADLLKPEFKGKIASFDPTDPIGSGTSLYLAKLHGVDFIGQLYKGQEIVLSRDRRQLIEWVARGTYPIVLGADAAQELQQFRDAGVTSIKALTMSDGPGNLIGGCSVVSLPKQTPHPAAARVFVNWFLSKNGQEAYVAGMHQPSDRQDIANEGVPDYLIPKPGLDYFTSYEETYVLEIRPQVLKDIGRIIGK